MTEKTATTPFIYWAQSNEQIFLRVDVEAKDVPVVTSTARRIEVLGRGVAPGSGARDYAVRVDFHGEIVPGSAGYRMDVLGSKLQFYIDKAPDHLGFWPNLLLGRAKPAWLKIDFDRFQSGDADSEEEKKAADEDGRGDRSMRDTVDNLLRDVKRPRTAPQPLNFKKMYLCTYNTFMLLGFFNVLLTMFKAYYHDGSESIPKTYESVGQHVRLLQFAQALEVVHAAIGLVRSGPVAAALQATGRLVMLHIIHFQPQLHETPLVFWLFIAWSLVEMVRYPFYLGQLYGFMPYPLKFLRYTSWIVLYPFGMLIETLIVIRALETYHSTHATPLFEFAGLHITVVRVIGAYGSLLPFAFLFLLRHMFAQTKSQLFNRNKPLAASRSKKVK